MLFFSKRDPRRAFLSHASADRTEVLKRAQMMRHMDVPFFQDILTLEPGDQWAKTLYREIDRCGCFLLFWSRAAAASPWVEREWRHALRGQSRSRKGLPQIKPVPLESPAMAPPPEELSQLHFDDPFRLAIQGSAIDDALKLQPEAPPERSVVTSIFSPVAVAPRTTFPLRIALTPADLAIPARHIAPIVDTSIKIVGHSELVLLVPIDTMLSLSAQMEGAIIANPHQSVRWVGKPIFLYFHVTVPGAERVQRVAATIGYSAGREALGRIDFELTVDPFLPRK